MQKFIAKYGLAAHLAILAVAPLFLFPFAGKADTGVVLLWLSALGFAWTFLEPSQRGGERLYDARRRVGEQAKHDPLFWFSLVLVVFAGVRALNGGISLAYNAETAAWYVSEPAFPLLPGAVGNSGFLPFAGLVALVAVVLGCRLSLGRSARMAYLLISSAASGASAVAALLAAHYGLPGAVGALACDESLNAFVGLAFGLHLMAGTVALVASFENRWNGAILLLFLSCGGNAAGAFAFSPPYLTAALALLVVILLIYAFAYACKILQASGEFKLLVVVGVSLALGGLLVALLMPKGVCQERLTAMKELDLVSAGYWKSRAALAAIAFKSWISHLWIGTGLDSFPFDFRFNAQAEDWTLLPRGTHMHPYGWWLILAERGVVGLVAFAAPFCFLCFTFVRRMLGMFQNVCFPHPACLLGLLAFVAFVASGFFDCSLLKVEVLLATGAIMAVSAASFPKGKKT